MDSKVRREIEDNSGIELAPLRSLDDFLLAEARFQLPQKDLDRWGNRVIRNLMYYQTNYFLLAIITFLVVGLLHPVQMVWGLVALSLAVSLFVYVGTSQHQVRQFKQNHPIVSVLLVLTAAYILVSMAGAVITFLFGVALPLALILIHASFRMRNLRNKLTGHVEKIRSTVGVQRTPMGRSLEWLAAVFKLSDVKTEVGKYSQ